MGGLELVRADVTRSYRTDTPIYDGTARTIASWHQSGGSDGIDFAYLASSGTITESLPFLIERQIKYAAENPHHFDAHKRVGDLGTARESIAQLRKLAEYAEKRGVRGPVDGWNRVWVDVLYPEDEYNTDEGDE